MKYHSNLLSLSLATFRLSSWHSSHRKQHCGIRPNAPTTSGWILNCNLTCLLQKYRFGFSHLQNWDICFVFEYCISYSATKNWQCCVRQFIHEIRARIIKDYIDTRPMKKDLHLHLPARKQLRLFSSGRVAVLYTSSQCAWIFFFSLRKIILVRGYLIGLDAENTCDWSLANKR